MDEDRGCFFYDDLIIRLKILDLFDKNEYFIVTTNVYTS